jgi:hypothetical protein
MYSQYNFGNPLLMGLEETRATYAISRQSRDKNRRTGSVRNMVEVETLFQS